MADAISHHPMQIGHRTIVVLAGVHAQERKEGSG
jgi:hypothetical protein